MAQAEIDIMTAKFRQVFDTIIEAEKERDVACHNSLPETRLVAVTKTKPVDDIILAYKCGQRHFGENYVGELLEKAVNEQIVTLCPDIKWHFIGHLQSNKVGKLLALSNTLFAIESVDSKGLAISLDSIRTKKMEADPLIEPLSVMVQVNTSGETSKHGVVKGEVRDLVAYIIEECDALKFRGLMTIGESRVLEEAEPNPDFIMLAELRQALCDDLKLDPKSFELSMGMSADYPEAVKRGSTNIRIGSILFGERNYNR